MANIWDICEKCGKYLGNIWKIWKISEMIGKIWKHIWKRWKISGNIMKHMGRSGRSLENIWGKQWGIEHE